MAPRRLPGEEGRKPISLELEGELVPAREGESVATALLLHGERVFARSVKYHRPRAPYCLTGECSQCLMRVDGVPNVFTCRTTARAGMRVERQNAYPSAKVDVFAAIDWMFPFGLDHHAMFAGVPVAEQVMAKVARHLAGLGLLPEKAAPARPAAEIAHTRVAVVGGGAAGLAAARALASAKAGFVLCERDAALGGRLRTGPPEPDGPALAGQQDALPSSAVRTGTCAVGLYEDAQGWFLALVRAQGNEVALGKLYAERFLLAPGGHAPLLPFSNNDLPGVLAGAAVSQLLRQDRVLAGEQVAVIGHGPQLPGLAAQLRAAGASATELQVGGLAAGAVDPATVKAHGLGWVRRLSWTDARGARQRLKCDLVAVSLPPAPSFELARQGGARVRYEPAQGGFVVEADARGATAAPRIFVAGDAAGARSAREAAESGARAAEAVLESLS